MVDTWKYEKPDYKPVEVTFCIMSAKDHEATANIARTLACQAFDIWRESEKSPYDLLDEIKKLKVLLS